MDRIVSKLFSYSFRGQRQGSAITEVRGHSNKSMAMPQMDLYSLVSVALYRDEVFSALNSG